MILSWIAYHLVGAIFLVGLIADGLFDFSEDNLYLRCYPIRTSLIMGFLILCAWPVLIIWSLIDQLEADSND